MIDTWQYQVTGEDGWDVAPAYTYTSRGGLTAIREEQNRFSLFLYFDFFVPIFKYIKYKKVVRGRNTLHLSFFGGTNNTRRNMFEIERRIIIAGAADDITKRTSHFISFRLFTKNCHRPRRDTSLNSKRPAFNFWMCLCVRVGASPIPSPRRLIKKFVKQQRSSEGKRDKTSLLTEYLTKVEKKKKNRHTSWRFMSTRPSN